MRILRQNGSNNFAGARSHDLKGILGLQLNQGHERRHRRVSCDWQSQHESVWEIAVVDVAVLGGVVRIESESYCRYVPLPSCGVCVRLTAWCLCCWWSMYWRAGDGLEEDSIFRKRLRAEESWSAESVRLEGARCRGSSFHAWVDPFVRFVAGMRTSLLRLLRMIVSLLPSRGWAVDFQGSCSQATYGSSSMSLVN